MSTENNHNGNPYGVRLVTWGTSYGTGTGIKDIMERCDLGGNVGHASIEINFPYNEVTKEWIAKYCKNIQISQQTDDKFSLSWTKKEVDIPVIYTTFDGKRILDPETWQAEHPDEPLAVSVYVSWVPGRLMPDRNQLDPFKQYWNRTFDLYTADKDLYLEHSGHAGYFQRGYEGRNIIQNSSGAFANTNKKILLEQESVLHNMTPEEKFLATNIDKSNKIIAMTEICQSYVDLKNSAKQTLEAVNNFTKKNNFSSDDLDQLCNDYPFINIMYDKHKDNRSNITLENYIKEYISNDLLEMATKITDLKLSDSETFQLLEQAKIAAKTIDAWEEFVGKNPDFHQLCIQRLCLGDEASRSDFNSWVENYLDEDFRFYLENYQMLCRVIERETHRSNAFLSIHGKVTMGIPNIEESLKDIQIIKDMYQAQCLDARRKVKSEYSDFVSEYKNLPTADIKKKYKEIFNLIKNQSNEAKETGNDFDVNNFIENDLESRLIKETWIKGWNNLISEYPIVDYFDDIKLLNPLIALNDNYNDLRDNYCEIDHYIEEYLESDFNYFIEKAPDWSHRFTGGLVADTLTIPIGDIPGENNFIGPKGGMNVEPMLKRARALIEDKQGYSLNTKNCSYVASEIAAAGVPSTLSGLFRDQGLGIARTPQSFLNGGNEYLEIIKNNDFSQDSKVLPDRSEIKKDKVSKESRDYFNLKEQIQGQDSAVNMILYNYSDLFEIPRNNPNMQLNICISAFEGAILELLGNEIIETSMSTALKNNPDLRYDDLTIESQKLMASYGFIEMLNDIENKAYSQILEFQQKSMTDPELSKEEKNDFINLLYKAELEKNHVPKDLITFCVDEKNRQVISKSVDTAMVQIKNKGKEILELQAEIKYSSLPSKTKRYVDKDILLDSLQKNILRDNLYKYCDKQYKKIGQPTMEEQRKLLKKYQLKWAKNIIVSGLRYKGKAVFKDNMNIATDDPFYEFKFLSNTLDLKIKSIGSKTIERALQVPKFIILAIALFDQMPIFLRRTVRNRVNKISNLFSSSKKLTKKSIQEQNMDYKFMSKLKASQQSQRVLLEQHAVVDTVIKKTSTKIEGKTARHILDQFKKTLDSDMVPVLSQNSFDLLLKSNTALITFFEKEDEKLSDKIVGLEEKLQQFSLLSKEKLEEADEYSDAYGTRGTEVSGAYLPDDIIAQFKRIKELPPKGKAYKNECERLKVLLAEQNKKIYLNDNGTINQYVHFLINWHKMSNSKLLASIEYILQPSNVNQFKLFEKHFLAQENPLLGVDKLKKHIKNKSSVEVANLLINQGMPPHLIDRLLSDDKRLDDLVTSLEYSALSNLATARINQLSGSHVQDRLATALSELNSSKQQQEKMLENAINLSPVEPEKSYRKTTSNSRREQSHTASTQDVDDEKKRLRRSK